MIACRMPGDLLFKYTRYNAKNLLEVICMKEILLMLFIAVYLGFGYWAIQYIKVNIMGVTAEYYTDTIAFYGQRLIFAAMLGWAAIPIAFIHKTFIAKE